jgi:hypothetical protein
MIGLGTSHRTQGGQDGELHHRTEGDPPGAAFALAYLVDRLVEDGALTYAEAARRLGVSRAWISQIANLRWLPVAVQERILAGENEGTERDLRKPRLSD